MHIVLTNTVTLNGGDRAIIDAELLLLKRTFGPEPIRFTVMDDWGVIAARHFPEDDFREQAYATVIRRREVDAIESPLLRRLVRRLVLYTSVPRARLAISLWGRGQRRLARLLLKRREIKAVELYERADLVVASGGTLLVDHYDLRHRFFEYDLILALNRPLVLYTQSMGPFKKPAHRRALRRILPRARAILLRDEASLAHVKDLGIKTDHCIVTADAAFALADRAAIAKSRTARLPAGGLKVAISARQWPHFHRRTSAEGMAALTDSLRTLIVRILADPTASVTLLSTCQGIPEYHYDDSRFALEIHAGLPSDLQGRVHVDRNFHTPAGIMAELAQFDFIVAMRMHFAIMGLCAGRPVLPIAYEFKTAELFRRLGLAEWIVDVEDIAPDSFVARWDLALGQCDARRAGFLDAVVGQSDETFRSVALLPAALGASGLR